MDVVDWSPIVCGKYHPYINGRFTCFADQTSNIKPNSANSISTKLEHLFVITQCKRNRRSASPKNSDEMLHDYSM